MNAEQLDFASKYAARTERLEKALCDARNVILTANQATHDDLLAEALLAATLPAREQAGALTRGLKRAQDLAFGQQTPVGVSSGKLNRTTKRLVTAVEEYAELERSESEVVATLKDYFSGFTDEVYRSAAKAILVFSEWDKDPTAATPTIRAQTLGKTLLSSLNESAAVELLLFVCPPVEFGYLNSNEPEQYLRTSMEHSLLSRQVKELGSLISSLDKVGLKSNLQVFIGDNDENDYIFPVLGNPVALNLAALESRRQRLVTATAEYLISKVDALTQDNLQIISLANYQLSARAEYIRDQVKNDAALFFSAEEFSAERKRMRELWEPGSYYDGIKCPSEIELDQIVKLKFAAYAMQGILAYQENPNLILIQTELPSKLRSKMLNVGRETLALEQLDAVYLSYG